MKQSKSVLAFKNELRNYLFYQEHIVKLQELIDYCYDMLGGVRGIDTSREPTHSLPNKDFEYRIRDEIEKHNRNIMLTKMRLNAMDEVLSAIDDEKIRDAIVRVYINGEAIFKVAQENFLSASGLARNINVTLKHILD